MLFRKWHLDWQYGVSELLIVVCGVLIALAAEGWRQNVRDRAIEREYVQRLKRDIAVDTLTLADMMVDSRERAAYATLVVKVIDSGGTDIPAAELVRAVEYAGWFAYPSYARTTIEELSSVGTLRLLRDTESRETVLRYYDTIEWHEQFQVVWRSVQGALRRIVSELLANEVRSALFNEVYAESCGPTVACEIGIPWEPHSLELDDSEAQSVRDRLLAHREARSLYAEMAEIHAIHYANLASIRAVADEAIASLEEYGEEGF